MENLMLSIKKLTDYSEECYAHISVNGEEKETLCAHTELSQKYWIRIFRKKHIHVLVRSLRKNIWDRLVTTQKDYLRKCW